MTKEEIRLQVAISVIQGVLEAKHGVIGEVVPSVAVAIALRIADAFVEEWYRETKEQPETDLKIEIGRWLDSLDAKYCSLVEQYSTQDVKETALHFYGLGLKARKEE